MVFMKRLLVFGYLFLAFCFLLTGCKTTKTGSVAEAPPVLVMENPPKTLAILPFENNSVTDPLKYVPLSKGIAAMLITDLNRAGTSIKLIEREKIQALLKEIALGQSGAIDQATAVRVGRVLGAQSIGFGSFMVLEEAVRIDLRIINVETSEVIMADSVTGNSGNFISLEQNLAKRIARSLKVAHKPENASGKSDISGALYFSIGVDAYDQGDHKTAEMMFEKAVAIDPSYRQKIRIIRGS